jgi:hypothetical protein
MRTAFFLIAVYFLFLIPAVLFGALVYMLYVNCTLMVVGTTPVFFSAIVFLRGVFLILPVMAGAASLLQVFYLVRHPAHPVAGTVIYVLLGLISWLIVVPGLFIFQQRFMPNVPVAASEIPVTAGFFRPIKNGVYYFSIIDAGNEGSGLYIDTAQLYDNAGGVQPISGMPASGFADDNFSDPLIMDMLKIPLPVRMIISSIKELFDAGYAALQTSWYAYLSFASLGLGILSLLGLKRMTRWRLFNITLVISGLVILLYINICMYAESPLRLFSMLSEFIAGSSSFKEKLSPVLVNGAFFLIFTGIGVINVMFRKDPNRENAT